MAFNLGSDGDEDEVVSTINTTPLVDVMLVLLIIYLITIPVVTQTIPMSLPKESNTARYTKPENIEISVNKDGDIFWNAALLPDNEALFQRLKTIAVMTPQPAATGAVLPQRARRRRFRLGFQHPLVRARWPAGQHSDH